MKKVVFIIAVFIIVLVSGCSNQTNMESKAKEPESTVSTHSDKSEIKYAAMLPDPQTIFKNGEITVTDKDGGKAYIFEVKNFEDKEIISYVSECKKLGFDDVSYETEKEFGAYSSDGSYWVQVNLDTDKKITYVVCQESKKK